MFLFIFVCVCCHFLSVIVFVLIFFLTVQSSPEMKQFYAEGHDFLPGAKQSIPAFPLFDALIESMMQAAGFTFHAQMAKHFLRTLSETMMRAADTLVSQEYHANTEATTCLVRNGKAGVRASHQIMSAAWTEGYFSVKESFKLAYGRERGDHEIMFGFGGKHACDNPQHYDQLYGSVACCDCSWLVVAFHSMCFIPSFHRCAYGWLQTITLHIGLPEGTFSLHSVVRGEMTKQVVIAMLEFNLPLTEAIKYISTKWSRWHGDGFTGFRYTSEDMMVPICSAVSLTLSQCPCSFDIMIIVLCVMLISMLWG